MVTWQEGRFITDWTDPLEVAKLLALLPVAPAESAPSEEQLQRRVEIYRAFGIGAAVVDHGVEFSPGVGPVDQPLLAALDVLFARRFRTSDSD